MRPLTRLLFLLFWAAEGQVLEVKENYTPGVEVIDKDPTRGTGTIYTSMYKLQKFFETEKKFVNDIRVLLDKDLVEAGARSNLGAYLASYDDVIGMQDEDETFLYNPLNVFTLVRHVAVGWSMVNQTLDAMRTQKPGSLTKRAKRVLSRHKRYHVPSAEDLDGIGLGIVRLQEYYRFNITSFVREGIFEFKSEDDGQTHRFETNGDVTVWDVFKIGVKGTNMLILGSGIDIMIEGLAKAMDEDEIVSTPPFVDPLEIKVLKNLIKTAKTVHDQKLDRWGPLTFQHSTNSIPYDRRLARKKKFKKSAKNLEKVVLDDFKIINSIQATKQARELCRSHDLRPPSVLRRLQCRYESNNIPYYIYGPRKIEVVSLRPRITIVHDFFTETECEDLIQRAGPLIKRSEMIGKTAEGAMDDRRVSEQTWLTENDSTSLRRITERMDIFFNVKAESMNHSEAYQVANYGLGGLYDSHYDQTMMGTTTNKIPMFNLYNGDRMATIMGYLSNVPMGGNTVFPLIGAYIKPEKRAVVIWWNMDKAGGYDALTHHAGCPVMIGSKWILNKWIRSNSQMFKRPCPTYTPREIRKFRSKETFQRGGWFTDP